MTWTDYDATLLALTAWREARGEGTVGMSAVMHVVRNRVTASNGATDIAAVCTKKWQFTSMTGNGDPELVLWPQRGDVQFIAAMGLVSDILNGVGDDPTNGATHYFAPAVVRPSWADKMKLVATIGHHEFYRT